MISFDCVPLVEPYPDASLIPTDDSKMQENQALESSVQDDGKIKNSQHSEELLDSSLFEKGSCQGDILKTQDVVLLRKLI